MTGTLYKLVGEKNRLDKTSYLTNATNITGVVIKFPSSIIEPILTLNGAAIANLWQFNYIRLDEFDRYYFINDIISTANNLWEVHCHVDVLMSWKDGILENKALIMRSSNKYNRFLFDKINKALPNYTITKSSSSNIFSLDEADYNGHPSCYNVLLFVRNKTISYQAQSGTDRTGSLQDPATGCGIPFFGGTIYIIDAIYLNTIIANYGSDSGIMSSIIKAIAFPFNVRDFMNFIGDGFFETQKGIHLTNYESGEEVVVQENDDIHYIPYYVSLKFRIKLNTLISSLGLNDNYLDMKPFTEYFIHLPMCGDVEIKPNMLYQNNVVLEGVFDIWAGTITYSIFTYDEYSTVVGSEKNELVEQVISGSQLVIAYDNADLALKEYTNMQNNKITSIVLGGATAVAGLVLALTGVGAGLGAGLMTGGISTAISSGVSLGSEMNNIQSSNSTVSGNNTGIYNTFVDCGIYFYKKAYDYIYDFSNDDYINIIGAPANNVVMLSECTGYLEVGTCHLDNVPALSQELDEIMQLLQSGILI